jgi:protein pelota
MKDDFVKYLNEKAVRSENTKLIHNKSKFVRVHTNSGHKHAIDEMFLDPAVTSRLGEVKAAREVCDRYLLYLFDYVSTFIL